MSEHKRLLAVRKALKHKTPEFIRQDFGKFKKIKAKWTRPKGHHSKTRERRKGNPRMVATGWRGPNAVRGLHSSGLARVIVASAMELARINKQTQGIILSSALGAKKRLVLIADAQKAGITILNLDPAAYVKRVQESQAAKKQQRAQLQKKKTEQSKKTKEKPKETIETLTAEEKQKAEKEEKDKLLTKKD